MNAIKQIHEYNGFKIAEITEEAHSELMRYWTEESRDIELPDSNITDYICWIEKDQTWDAICAFKGKDDVLMFGESFNNKEYAFKWIADEYVDIEELKEEDRKRAREIWELAQKLAKERYEEETTDGAWDEADKYEREDYVFTEYFKLKGMQI